MLKKILPLLFSCTLFIAPIFAQAPRKTSIAVMSNALIRDADNLWSKSRSPQVETTKELPQKRFLIETEVKAVTSIMTNGLEQLEIEKAAPSMLFAPQLLNDLQFFNPGGRSVFNQINRTQTIAGAIVLSTTLAEGSQDAEVLLQRQEMVKELHNNEPLRKNSVEHLQKLHKTEQQLISIWAYDERGDISAQIAHETLNSFKFFHDHPNLHKSLQQVSWYAWQAVKYAGPAFAVLYALNALEKYHTNKITFKNCLALTSLAGISAFQLPEIANKHLHQNIMLQDLVMQSATGYRQLVKQTEDFVKELRSNIKKEILPTSILEYDQKRIKYDALVTQLRSMVEAHRFFDIYRTLVQNASLIGDLLIFVGELDAYVSCACLTTHYAAMRNRGGEKTFVSFAKINTTSPTPYIKAEGFWNPIIDSYIVQPSSIELGKPGGPRNLVITGPNAGGKSMNLRGILVQLICLHSYQIAFAKEFESTLFKLIIGQLKSVDDTAGDCSRLKLEAMVIRDILKKIGLLNAEQREFGMIITDEIFTGTEIEPAIELSLEIGKHIAKKSNVSYLLATHYTPLTELEKLTNGIFANYKVIVLKAEDNLLYPYKLFRGVGGANVAIDIFAEEMKNYDMENDEFFKIISAIRYKNSLQATSELSSILPTN